MSIALIYARSRNYCIGVDGDLPWRLPAEFAFFKQTTLGSAVIMGRKSYEDHNSELPDRLNIVVTRQPDYTPVPGVRVADSLVAALALARDQGKPVFVIGGVGLFREAMPLADTVFETIVEADIEGDTFVDAFDFSGWGSERVLQHDVDAKHRFAFTAYRHSRPTSHSSKSR